jgi:CRP/FNR family transcriptional regulator, cyclic AMP receptor protein
MPPINIFNHDRNTETVAAGALLFREGDPGDVMFAVVDGQIDLTQGRETIETVGPGGIIGELGLIDAAPRAATARARVETKIARVDRQRFEYLVHEHPHFALQVMTVMAERIRRTHR